VIVLFAVGQVMDKREFVFDSIAVFAVVKPGINPG
jgi:hypothetical protein